MPPHRVAATATESLRRSCRGTSPVHLWTRFGTDVVPNGAAVPIAKAGGRFQIGLRQNRPHMAIGPRRQAIRGTSIENTAGSREPGGSTVVRCTISCLLQMTNGNAGSGQQGEAMESSTGDAVPLGERREIDGHVRAHYYGYWVKVYPVPADSLQGKRSLIEALTRRLFNHTEHGLNIPGIRLDEARAAYEAEPDPEKRRVKGGMLAGALFNRATDIITKLVEMQALGVDIQPDNQLMRECGRCLEEALTLGKMVLHRSGEEGIDELWGEPFKAFSFPVEGFFESRYIKIAQTMRDIDRICEAIDSLFGDLPTFASVVPLVRNLGDKAKTKSETLRTDPEIFDVWADFVVANERLRAFSLELPTDAILELRHEAERGRQLILQGAALVSDITRARVPMPKSTREYIERCTAYRSGCLHLDSLAQRAA